MKQENNFFFESEPDISKDDTRPSESIAISSRTDRPRFNKKKVAVGVSLLIGAAVVADATINAIKNRLNLFSGVSQTSGQTPTNEPTLTPSPTGTPNYQSTYQANQEIIAGLSTQKVDLETRIAQAETEITTTPTPDYIGTSTSMQATLEELNGSLTPHTMATSDRQIANPDRDTSTETATSTATGTPVGTSTVESTQTPTSETVSTIPVFTFYETSDDAVGDNPVEVNSIVPGGITSAEDGHVLDLKSITLATFVFNGTGYGLKEEDLHRLATSRAFLERQYGVTGKVNTDTFQIYSDGQPQMFRINGINFITNSDSYAKGFGVDENGETTLVEIYQTESENSYIDEVAVDDNTGIAFVVEGSDVREHGFITYVITDKNGKITRLSVDKMCGNVVAENGTMVYPTAGATVTLQATPTPILITPTYPSSTNTLPAPSATPLLTLTPVDTIVPSNTPRTPTATIPPTTTAQPQEPTPTARPIPTNTLIPPPTATDRPQPSDTPRPPATATIPPTTTAQPQEPTVTPQGQQASALTINISDVIYKQYSKRWELEKNLRKNK